MQGNFCVDSKVTRYLTTTRLPRAGTVCRPDSTPFEPLPAAARARALARAKVGGGLLPEQVRAALSPR
jgi:hypothetical protein